MTDQPFCQTLFLTKDHFSFKTTLLDFFNMALKQGFHCKCTDKPNVIHAQVSYYAQKLYNQSGLLMCSHTHTHTKHTHAQRERGWGGRERQPQRERQRETERERDRQSGRDREWEKHTHTHTHMHWGGGGWWRQRVRQRDRQRDRCIHTHTHTHTHSFLLFQLNTNLFDTIVMVMSAKDDVNFRNTSCKFFIIWPSHVGECYHQVCTLWKRRTACKDTVATCALPRSLIQWAKTA